MSRTHSPSDLAQTSTRPKGGAGSTTESERDQIRRLVWAGTPASEVALMFNLTAGTVRKIAQSR